MRTYSLKELAEAEVARFAENEAPSLEAKRLVSNGRAYLNLMHEKTRIFQFVKNMGISIELESTLNRKIENMLNSVQKEITELSGVELENATH